MTTLNDVSQLQGKKVLMLTQNNTVYIGRMSDLRLPSASDMENNIVALVSFNYCRFSEEATIEGPKERFMKENVKTFPVRLTDELHDFEKYEAAIGNGHIAD